MWTSADPSLTALRALLEVREEVRDICDLQLVAFPQEGIFSFPDGGALMRRAMELGCDLVGGSPHFEMTRDLGVEDVHFAFALAKEYWAGRGLPLRRDGRSTVTVHGSHGGGHAGAGLAGTGDGQPLYGHALPTTIAYAAKLIALLARAQINVVANPFDNVTASGSVRHLPPAGAELRGSRRCWLAASTSPWATTR